MAKLTTEYKAIRKESNTLGTKGKCKEAMAFIAEKKNNKEITDVQAEQLEQFIIAKVARKASNEAAEQAKALNKDWDETIAMKREAEDKAVKAFMRSIGR